MYVLDAIIELNESRQQELHDYERPIAYLAFQNAEINRDTKKRRKAYSPDDFYYYSKQESERLPGAKYGAAALELIRRELYPRWALFVYGSLKVNAENAVQPEILCLQCEDALLLAPQIDGRTITGMLVAQRSSSDQVREMRTESGESFRVKMPYVASRFEAVEDAELLLLQ